MRRAVVLTDGHQNAGPDPLPIATDLKTRGVIIDVICVGQQPSDVDEALLKQICPGVGAD